MGILAPGTLGVESIGSSRLQKTPLKQSRISPLKVGAFKSPARHSAKTLKIEAAQQTQKSDLFLTRHKQAKQGPLLAIIDDYETGLKPAFVKKPTLTSRLLLEAPDNGLVSHGHIVEAHAKTANPNIQIYRIQTPHLYRKDLLKLGQKYPDIPTALRKLKKELETNSSINAINLSFGLAIPIQRLQEDLGLPDLTAENIQRYRKTILKNFDKIQFTPPVLGIKGLNWPDGGNKE